MRISISDITKIIDGKISNNNNVIITKLSKIEDAQENSLSFLANLKYKKFLYTTKASAVIVKNDFKTEKEIKPILIYVKDPYEAFTKILNTVAKQNDKIG